jgi:curved DNA-binding protein CbpA
MATSSISGATWPLPERGRAATMDTGDFDPYATLDLSTTATQDEITHAYRRKLREYHPDTRSTSLPTFPAADEQLRRILQAYAILRDPDRRAAYHRAVGQMMARGQSGAVRIPVRHRRAERKEPRRPSIRIVPIRWL